MPITRANLSSVRVVVSDRAEVVDDAMRLAHDGYVDAGFLKPRPSGRRFVAPYLNPGTLFLVAYAGDEPISTVALVDDGPFGLPADRAFVEELDEIRESTLSLREASAFVIAPRWRRHRRLLLGYVLGTVVRLYRERGFGHRVVFAVEPRQAALFASIFSGPRMVGPRPLLRAPGTLIITEDVSTTEAFFTDPSAPAPRRMVGEHALSPMPEWLEREEPSGAWHRELLPPLLAESGLEDRIRRQMQLLKTSTAQNSSRPIERVIV